jgi:hypothetical protein
MNMLIGVVILIFGLIWASRVEIGINDIRKSVQEIEKQLKSKENE